MEELRSCREKLPADQQTKLKSDEIQVMSKAMGGMGGMPPAHSMGGPEGGAMGGAGSPPGGDQNGAPPSVPATGGSAAAVAPAGSAAPAAPATGSAK
jgi:hypothetical protein